MTGKYKLGVAVAVVLLSSISLLAYFGFTQWLSLSDCDNQLIEEAVAPGGRVKAVVFRRDCGATTGYSTQVAILAAADDLPDESGNAFVADSDHGKAPPGERGGPLVHIAWLGSDLLRIEHHTLARVFLSEGSVRGVKIEYVATSKQEPN